MGDIYSDLNQVDPTNNPLVKNEDSIYQSINNILVISPGERLFRPLFGSDIDQIPFEPLNDGTSLLLFKEIVEAIDRWETRVRIDNSTTTITPNYEEQSYTLLLAFIIQRMGVQQFEQQATIEE